MEYEDGRGRTDNEGRGRGREREVKMAGREEDKNTPVIN